MGEDTEPLNDSLPDRFGVVLPEGGLVDLTDSARLFDQDPEARARMLAAKVGGRPVRIVTKVVDLDAT